MKKGYGNCPDCMWFNAPEGCNVERDSKVCLLNKRPREGSEPVGLQPKNSGTSKHLK